MVQLISPLPTTRHISKLPKDAKNESHSPVKVLLDLGKGTPQLPTLLHAHHQVSCQSRQMVRLPLPIATPAQVYLTSECRIPPVVAIAAVGYGVSAYREQSYINQRMAAAEAAERRRRQAALVLDDAYGDRTSLEGLERAMRVYEAQAREQQGQGRQ